MTVKPHGQPNCKKCYGFGTIDIPFGHKECECVKTIKYTRPTKPGGLKRNEN